MKKLICLLLVGALLCGLWIPACATGDPEPVQIMITQENDVYDIYDALYTARYNATAENPYEIHVAAGDYYLNRAFHIFSNTSIIADDEAHFILNYKDNMLKVGTTGADPMSGYGYENIHIVGGDWDMNGYSATMFKVVHASNCEIAGVAAHNIKDAHFMEIAGVDGMSITDCHFYDMNVTVEDGREAIQIDVLHENHISGYAHLNDEIDYLCKNISVKNCVFDGVRRGVASHTAVHGKYYENIEIIGNTFNNTQEKAILCYNMKNVVIADNKISCGEVGIEVKTMDRNGAGTYLSAEDRSYDDRANPEYLGVDIRGNTVVAKHNHAVILNGIRMVKGIAKDEYNDKLPAGDYYVEGVTIRNNTLTAYAKKCGVKLKFAKNVTIDKNTVPANSTAETPFYITDGCSKVSVTNNVIKEGTKAQHKVYNGIRVINFNDEAKYPKGRDISITGNTISNLQLGGYGIRISDAAVGEVCNNKITNLYYRLGTGILVDINEESVSANYINNNLLKSCKIAIRLIKATAGEISGNDIYKTTGNTIQADTKSIARKITNNSIDQSGDTAILLKQSNSDEISDNMIVQPTEIGIYCYSGAKIGKIVYNTITGDKLVGGKWTCRDMLYGVVITNATVNYLEKNKISDSEYFGVYLNGSTATQVGSMKNNNISYCYMGLKVLQGPKANIHPNTFSKNADCNRYVINGTKQYRLGNPTAVPFAAKKSGKTAYMNWTKKGSVSGYLIYRSTDASSGFQKIGSTGANATAYTDKTVKANTTYYYRILPYYKVPGSNVVTYAKWTQSKAVKM